MRGRPAIFKQFDKDEPFTKSELRRYDKQKRQFIRNIQLSQNLNKKDAIAYFKNYLKKSQKTRKEIRENIIKTVKTYYPRKGKKRKEMQGKPIKKKKQRKQKRFSAKYATFTEWAKTQKDSKYTQKIIKRWKKYPNATLDELRGVKKK